MRWALPPLLVFAACVAAAIAAGAALPDLGTMRPAVCDGGRCFCEAPRATGWTQPANTLSNLGYVLVGLLILARAARPTPGLAGDNLLRRHPAYVRVFGVAVVAIGLGSLFFHGTLTFVGQFMDLLGMYLFSNLLLMYNVARWRGLSPRAFGGAYIALTAGMAAVLLIAPEFRRWLFAAGIAGALALEAAIALRRASRAQPAWFAASLGAFGLANGVWSLDNAGLWCEPLSWLQGHAIWHLLGAAAAGLIFVYYWKEKSA